MPKDSNNYEEDKKLFEFYLEYEYIPDDFNHSKQNKKDTPKINKNKKEVSNKLKDEPAYTEEDREMFLKACENLDCSNHVKHEMNNTKTYLKPNTKNAVPKEKLDLHGFTRERALAEIRNFIYDCKKRKRNPILIIHGKGIGSENKIPVLKNLVEYYIATEGKHYIKYSSDAPSNFGGSGAKIIYLK